MSNISLNVEDQYYDDFVGSCSRQGVDNFGFESRESDKRAENALSFNSASDSKELYLSDSQENARTPIKRPYLKKGEGKSLVISNSRKESKKRGEGFVYCKNEKEMTNARDLSVSNFEHTFSRLTTEDCNSEIDYDKIIQKKLDLIDEKIEYIHETQEDIIKKKAVLASERKKLNNYKAVFEKELKIKYEKSLSKFEDEIKKLKFENNKLQSEKANLNDLITRLKITIRDKDYEISRLKKVTSAKEKKGMENKLDSNKMAKDTNYDDKGKFNGKISNSVVPDLLGNSNVGPASNVHAVPNRSAFIGADRDLLIEDIILKFDFEKELDSLYGILSTSFNFSIEGVELVSLPKIPEDINKPWCDIENPYKINKDDILKTITFVFPSGLVEIVFFDDSNGSICPVNTRKLLWTHLGWCILVYPNNDIKAIKPNRDIIYHYVNRDIVKCVINSENISDCELECSKLYISKFFSLKQLQCFDPDTKKTYIIHSDKTRQIINNSFV